MPHAPTPLLALSDALAELAETGAARAVAVEGREGAWLSGILWQQDLIATALPALARLEGIGLLLPGGRRVEGRLVGRDPLSGLALLRAETGPVTPLPAPRPARLAPGQLILAVGREATAPVAACGILARADGLLDLRLAATAEGGPVLGADGSLLGMALRTPRPAADSAEGAEAAPEIRLLPATTIADLAGLLGGRGRAGRGYLGLAMQGVRGGVLVLGVDPGSPGARAGLLLGDVILAADGRPLGGLRDLLAQLAPERVGQALALDLQRGGQPMRLTVTIGERPGLAG